LLKLLAPFASNYGDVINRTSHPLFAALFADPIVCSNPRRKEPNREAQQCFPASGSANS
jgi:hypothetical protein